MVYIFLANGFEECEALCPWDILKRGGVDVSLVSVNPVLAVTGAHGITVVADKTLSEIRAEDAEMLVFPGGMPGTSNIDADVRTDALVNYAVKNGLYIGAICAAPMILGKRGVLCGKKATCFPGFEEYLVGAELSSERVVKDGKIITSKGAGAAYEFGFELLSVLKGSETAKKVKVSMQ